LSVGSVPEGLEIGYPRPLESEPQLARGWLAHERKQSTGPSTDVLLEWLNYAWKDY
jgi:hypothetical protein